jgi:hypothetical protein
MRKLVQVEADALPDRPVSPEVVSHGIGVESGGVSLENKQPHAPASKQYTPNETDTAIKTARPAADESADRRFVWLKDAESSFNPNLDPMRLSTAPPDSAEMPVNDLQRGDLASARHAYSPIHAIAKYPYKYCKSDKKLMQTIASASFDGQKVFKREWDLYALPDTTCFHHTHLYQLLRLGHRRGQTPHTRPREPAPDFDRGDQRSPRAQA